MQKEYYQQHRICCTIYLVLSYICRSGATYPVRKIKDHVPSLHLCIIVTRIVTAWLHCDFEEIHKIV